MLNEGNLLESSDYQDMLTVLSGLTPQNQDKIRELVSEKFNASRGRGLHMWIFAHKFYIGYLDGARLRKIGECSISKRSLTQNRIIIAEVPSLSIIDELITLSNIWD